jgi:hypothetical protein
MKRAACLSVVASILITGCGQSDTEPDTSATNTAGTSSGNPITAPVDYIGAVGAAQKQAVRVVDLTTLSQAVQAFHAGEDRLPSSLQEIVSEGYLPRLPAPPTGSEFAYDPRTGTVTLVPAGAPGR